MSKVRILKAREKQVVSYKRNPMRVAQQIFQQKLCRPEGSGMTYSKC